ncbi:MAG: hypothetical protein V4599_13015 [Verrucomicrobiota bacterium]
MFARFLILLGASCTAGFGSVTLQQADSFWKFDGAASGAASNAQIVDFTGNHTAVNATRLSWNTSVPATSPAGGAPQDTLGRALSFDPYVTVAGAGTGDDTTAAATLQVANGTVSGNFSVLTRAMWDGPVLGADGVTPNDVAGNHWLMNNGLGGNGIGFLFGILGNADGQTARLAYYTSSGGSFTGTRTSTSTLAITKGASPVETVGCWCGPYRCACRRYYGPGYGYYGGGYAPVGYGYGGGYGYGYAPVAYAPVGYYGGYAPVVHQGEWLEMFVRYEATADVGPVNCGVALFDRFDRLLFARGWLNAGVEPVWLRVGEGCVGRYRLNLDLEPGEYTVTLSAAEPLRAADGGWDQDVGGAWYAELKRATKVAVLPRADGRRTHYGPSPLQSEVGVEIEEPAATVAATEVPA